MNRSRATLIVSIVLLVAVGAWIAGSTEWASITVPMPPRGEAARNPFYGAQRFAESLGARTFWDQTLQLPQSGAVLVLSGWRWNLSDRRRLALERWVASGGRLVVDRSVVNDRAFQVWSRIEPRFRTIAGEEGAPPEAAGGADGGDGPNDATGAPDAGRRPPDDGAEGDLSPAAPAFRDRCRAVREIADPERFPVQSPVSYQLCGVLRWMYLVSEPAPRWALLDDLDTLQAVRVAIGRGSVTVVNAAPFRYRGMIDGDHGRLFVGATQLRRGDTVRFLSEQDHPSLLVLMWRQGAPIVVLALAAIGLALWRGAPRFGPPAPPETSARRSLSEQILGTGRFALQRGDGAALHAALVRGLDEAAQRRVPGYARLSGRERAAALARLTGMDGAALDAALHDPTLRRPDRLRGTVALLELARRRTLVAHTRSSHGTE